MHAENSTNRLHVDKKLFSPSKGERTALSANERIAEFLDFAVQAKFAYVNQLRLQEQSFRVLRTAAEAGRGHRRFSQSANMLFAKTFSCFPLKA